MPPFACLRSWESDRSESREEREVTHASMASSLVSQSFSAFVWSAQLQHEGHSDAQDGSTGDISDVHRNTGRLCAQAGADECAASRLFSQLCSSGEAPYLSQPTEFDL